MPRTSTDYTQYLSDELLVSIFSNLISSIAILPPAFGDSRLQLMAVSQRWKYIILGSSTFWDTIVKLPRSPEVCPQLSEISEQWLRKRWNDGHILSSFLLQPSQDFVHINQPGPWDCTERFRIVEDGILPMAGHTTVLYCTLSTKDGIDAFFSIPSGSFKFLERLSISVPVLPTRALAHATAATLTEGLDHFDAFHRWPRLRSAVISIMNGINPLAFKLPWYQFTELDMLHTILSPYLFMQVLSSCAPSLKDGSFAIRFEEIVPSTASSRKDTFDIVKPRFLQNLRLRLIDPTLDTRIFPRIHLTALSHLRIELVQDRLKEGWTMPIYKKLLSKSSNVLKSLGFWDAPFRGYRDEEAEYPTLIYTPSSSHQDLDELFAILPNLQHLHLPIGVYIQKSAADKIAQGTLLPSLTSLDTSSTVGVDILGIVERRNELAYHLTGSIGSSKLDHARAATGIYPTFISRVLLLTPSSNFLRVERAKRFLLSSSSSQRTALDIQYANFQVSL
ncbi:hypothetical protein M413DRAFT_30641 [Hebeloma cylindrosporum]|uniref:F-box domain-containing protein n=1 Tax=Hebeloma cylindrosporum TaxID=76867 RepID=A0A0C3C258_HEBCY|nr:hypothetical protein M413DRAFT_30641 [Hebeloma cylindrosporum h7]